MKITGVKATPVNIPLRVPFLFSVRDLSRAIPKSSSRCLPMKGWTGLGEAPSPECAAMINDQLAPALIGE